MRFAETFAQMSGKRSILSVLFVTIVWSILSQALADHGIDEDDTLYLLLLGKSGHGKSALGNHLLDREVFESRLSPNSVTKNCQMAAGQIGDKHVVVVDTPGTMDTEMDRDEYLRHFSVAAALNPHGYHAVLLVFSSITMVTAEEKEAIEILEHIFGDSFFEHVIFVFTYANVFAANIGTRDISDAFNDYLRNLDSTMKTFIAKSGQRCILVDPTEKVAHARKDVNLNILGMVEDLVIVNKGKASKHFDVFKKIKKLLQTSQGKGGKAKTAEEKEWEMRMKERELEMEKEREKMKEREWEREKERMRLAAEERKWEREHERMMVKEKQRERSYGLFNTGIVPLDNIANYIFDGLSWLFKRVFTDRKRLN